MASTRGEFSSRFGFIMAAAGSAVGLGNIWGFPTQAASNGGAAFLLVYLALAFTLAYPALMAELIIGRHAHANAVSALRRISPNTLVGSIGALGGMARAGLILGREGLKALAAETALGESFVGDGALGSDFCCCCCCLSEASCPSLLWMSSTEISLTVSS